MNVTKTALTIAVAAAASFGAQRWTSAARGETSQAADTPDTGSATRNDLLGEIDALREKNRQLADEVARLANTPAAARVPLAAVSDGDIAAALERWRAAHPGEAQAAAESAPARARALPIDSELAALPIHDLVALLSDQGLTNMDRQQYFQELREAGRIDEYVAEIERLAAADPENADLQVALGNAYLQKLFGVGNTPEAGVWAIKSDAAFDRALEIDDQNWAARFTKAVSLSNWPAFLGRGPEAIEHLEILLDQQAELELRPEFAMTYLFLGNLYQSSGDREKALATWQEGLGLFPEVDDLERAIELAEKSE